MLSKKQKEQLKKPCPLCKKPLTWCGDLGDYKHDMVYHDDKNPCRFVMMFDGEILDI
jgi:hypothetical protein